MSRREDNVSCIDVTIMDRFAHSALPAIPLFQDLSGLVGAARSIGLVLLFTLSFVPCGCRRLL